MQEANVGPKIWLRKSVQTARLSLAGSFQSMCPKVPVRKPSPQPLAHESLGSGRQVCSPQLITTLKELRVLCTCLFSDNTRNRTGSRPTNPVNPNTPRRRCPNSSLVRPSPPCAYSGSSSARSFPSDPKGRARSASSPGPGGGGGG